MDDLGYITNIDSLQLDPQLIFPIHQGTEPHAAPPTGAGRVHPGHHQGEAHGTLHADGARTVACSAGTVVMSDHRIMGYYMYYSILAGGFKPSEKYESIGMIIPNIWEKWSIMYYNVL